MGQKGLKNSDFISSKFFPLVSSHLQIILKLTVFLALNSLAFPASRGRQKNTWHLQIKTPVLNWLCTHCFESRSSSEAGINLGIKELVCRGSMWDNLVFVGML